MTKQTRPELSRDKVVDAALKQARRGGVAAVTVRGVAAALKVTPMAIYWHVPSRDALLDAMGDRVCAELTPPSVPDGAAWPDRYLADLREFVAVLRRHPGAAQVVPSRMPYHEGSRRVLEQRIGLLLAAGYAPAAAVRAARQATRLAIELVTDPMYGQRADAARRAHIDAEYQEFAASLGADYPALREVGELLTADHDHDAYIDLGLRTFVAGLAAAPPRTDRSAPN